MALHSQSQEGEKITKIKEAAKPKAPLKEPVQTKVKELKGKRKK